MTMNSRRHNLLRRDPRCHYCKRRVGPGSCTLDHYVPKALGGITTKKNIKLSCRKCNSVKGDMPPYQWEALLPKLLEAGYMDMGHAERRQWRRDNPALDPWNKEADPMTPGIDCKTFRESFEERGRTRFDAHGLYAVRHREECQACDAWANANPPPPTRVGPGTAEQIVLKAIAEHWKNVSRQEVQAMIDRDLDRFRFALANIEGHVGCFPATPEGLGQAAAVVLAQCLEAMDSK